MSWASFLEAVDRSDLGEQLGGGEGPAAGQVEQRGCKRDGSLLELISYD